MIRLRTGRWQLWLLVLIFVCVGYTCADGLKRRDDAPLTLSIPSPPSSAASSSPPPSPPPSSSAASQPDKPSAAPSSAAPASGSGASKPGTSSSPSGNTTNSAPNAAPSSSIDYPSVTIASALSTSASFNVMAAPTSLPPPDANITSNVTVPSPTASASWNGSVPQAFSIMYRGSQQALDNLPTFYFQIANSSQTDSAKQLICDTQTHFCLTAGCSDDDDEISHNFCDVANGMGTMCTCKKSVSRLAQYQWPVQSQDCLLRLQTCIDTCNNQRETPFSQRSECTQACNDQIGSSCNKPEQYGASYMVMKPGQMPTYKIVDQSQPQSAGAQLRSSVILVTLVPLAVGAWLLVL